MKKNGNTIAVVLGLALGAAMPLAAQAQAATPGIYAGVSAGQAEAQAYDCAARSTCKNKGTVYRIFGGYQFSRNLAVEAAFSDLGKVSSSSPGFDQSVKVRAGELTVVASYPASERFSVFGKAGGYYAQSTSTTTQSGTTTTVRETNGNPTFGAGLQFFMTRNLALRGEGQRYMKVGGGKIGDSPYNAYTLGLLWKFQ